MKKHGLICFFLFCTFYCALYSQEEYQFEILKENKITPVKNQSRSGTCWAFSGVGMIESELLRLGKGEYDLSEMFIVNHSFRDKAEKYVRLHGFLSFTQGGSFADVLYTFKHYGAIPRDNYKGLEYGENTHAHSEMEEAAAGYLKAIIENPNGKLSPSWKKGYQHIIDSYLGEIPETFSYQGKQYSPRTFGESLGLNIDDYISLTSFSHKPFYSKYEIEVPDNWRWAQSYNLPIEELLEVFDHAIQTGYTIAWATDVSEIGFTREGVATVPDVELIESAGSDQERWVGLTKAEKEVEIKKIASKPCKEIKVTQALRQQAYDNYQTTDDHGMLVYGIAKDQSGKKFYLVKNSWGTDNPYKGIWYASEAFVAYKTMNIVLHKDALTSNIKAKLGLK